MLLVAHTQGKRKNKAEQEIKSEEKKVDLVFPHFEHRPRPGGVSQSVLNRPLLCFDVPRYGQRIKRGEREKRSEIPLSAASQLEIRTQFQTEEIQRKKVQSGSVHRYIRKSSTNERNRRVQLFIYSFNFFFFVR